MHQEFQVLLNQKSEIVTGLWQISPFVLSLSKDERRKSRFDRVNPGHGTQRERFMVMISKFAKVLIVNR
jgi:hypothetical protein